MLTSSFCPSLGSGYVCLKMSTSERIERERERVRERDREIALLIYYIKKLCHDANYSNPLGYARFIHTVIV